MSITAQILDQRVRHAAEVMKSRLSTTLGNRSNDEHRLASAALTVLVMKTALGLDDSEAIEAIVDGGDDFGIDALHWNWPQSGIFRVFMVQTKLAKRLDGASNFPEAGVRGMIDAVKTLLDRNADFTVNDRLRRKLLQIRELVAQGYIPEVTALLANNGRRWTDAAQKRIDNADCHKQVKWLHVGADELVRLMRPQASIDAKLHLTGKYMVEDFDYRRALIGRVSVDELATLFTEHGDQLLERNVRRFLGMGDSHINKGIAHTLQDPAEQANFYFYNNGITIVCRKFAHDALQSKNTTVQLQGMQIVNGGQTSQVIARVLAEMESTPNASVLLRVYELSDLDKPMVGNITFATNSQNPVTLADLKANDPKQIHLEQSIEELGYRYRRKRSDAPVADNEFTSMEVARSVFNVWRGRSLTIAQDADFFSIHYDEIFDGKLNGAQAVLSSLINRIVGEIENAEVEKNKMPSGPFEINPITIDWNFIYYPYLFGKLSLNKFGLESFYDLTHNNFQDFYEFIHRNRHDIFNEAQKVAREDDWGKYRATKDGFMIKIPGIWPVASQNQNASHEFGNGSHDHTLKSQE